ncbi:carbohydrate-binding domain-containing protein [Limnoglobus roseus]|uniref:Carbohydrate binding module xylan-binding domain-containing protein n=1 Tax=Limnoglobus roseus TaxID=2598579 RepID=A0A5C1ADR5_9BACT|nr:carbohydrate-binding domain-containing protein [Limnoglobus roseus]QEL15208.1 hypothetical protein PX52LOC_02123 [Limnoglobus roseus]
MFKRTLFAGVAALLGVAVVIAADPIKLELKNFKLKAAFDGGENLVGHDEGENRIFYYTNGSATAEVKVPEDGEYTIKIDAGCTKAEKDFAQIKISVGDVVVKDKFDLTAEEQKEYTFTAKLKKGDSKLVIEFLNDKYKENEYDLNFFLYKASLEKK